MNLQRKLQIVEQSIRSISQHHDEDASVRQAALDAIEKVLTGEREAIKSDLAAKISAALGADL